MWLSSYGSDKSFQDSRHRNQSAAGSFTDAGGTDNSFPRLLKQRGGIGLTVSEFISVEGLTRNNPKSKRQMRFYENERPFAVQIFGGQAERMRMAAEMAEEIGADILDINCGCPAPKVVKHG